MPEDFNKKLKEWQQIKVSVGWVRNVATGNIHET
jgi:hypothetical protein